MFIVEFVVDKSGESCLDFLKLGWFLRGVVSLRNCFKIKMCYKINLRFIFVLW